MSEIEKYRDRIPALSKLDIAKILFPDPGADELELIISIEQHNLNIKELSTFLETIYRFDGFLSELGFLQYSRYPHLQIKIAEVRQGSWEIVLREYLQTINAERLVIVGFALKYIPKILTTLLDMGLKYVDFQIKKEELLEKKDKRKFRRDVRDIINDDESLQKLDKKTQDKVIDILDELYSANTKRLPASSRFVSNSVKAIKLSSKKKG
jgi:hypothetical protein